MSQRHLIRILSIDSCFGRMMRTICWDTDSPNYTVAPKKISSDVDRDGEPSCCVEDKFKKTVNIRNIKAICDLEEKKFE